MKLYLFYKSLRDTIPVLEASSIDTVIIDWEHIGKHHRQLDYDTEINHQDVNDLRALRERYSGTIVCRINGFPHFSADEIRLAIDNGADIILLPMVKGPDHMEQALAVINNHAKLAIMIETQEAVNRLDELMALSPYFSYFGLNDYAISAGHPHLFTALAQDVIEKVAQRLSNLSFGFGGLTHPALGEPIPSYLLLAEMLRLQCDFTFLRRSFYRDLKTFSPHQIESAIQQHIEKITSAPSELLSTYRRQLKVHIDKI